MAAKTMRLALVPGETQILNLSAIVTAKVTQKSDITKSP